jgi:hypothetical protein
MNRRTFFRMTAGLTALCSGIKAFGAATPQKTPLDRVCVRRLLLEIKKFIARTGEHYIFNGDNKKNRKQFCKVVNEYMEDIKQRKGLASYVFVCGDLDSQSCVLDQNKVDGYLFIQPNRSEEYFYLDFNVIRTNS